jgi:hypothetical protein
MKRAFLQLFLISVLTGCSVMETVNTVNEGEIVNKSFVRN